MPPPEEESTNGLQDPIQQFEQKCNETEETEAAIEPVLTQRQQEKIVIIEPDLPAREDNGKCRHKRLSCLLIQSRTLHFPNPFSDKHATSDSYYIS